MMQNQRQARVRVQHYRRLRLRRHVMGADVRPEGVIYDGGYFAHREQLAMEARDKAYELAEESAQMLWRRQGVRVFMGPGAEPTTARAETEDGRRRVIVEGHPRAISALAAALEALLRKKD